MGVVFSPQTRPELVLTSGMPHRATFGVEPRSVIDSVCAHPLFVYRLPHRGRRDAPLFVSRDRVGIVQQRPFEQRLLVERPFARAEELGAGIQTESPLRSEQRE